MEHVMLSEATVGESIEQADREQERDHVMLSAPPTRLCIVSETARVVRDAREASEVSRPPFAVKDASRALCRKVSILSLDGRPRSAARSA